MDKGSITDWFKNLQDQISSKLEELDGNRFREDLWQREEGGGGRTRILEGNVIEKGGVNFSAVHGPMPEKIASALKLGSTDFYATGVSIVLHPHNPHVPIIHMNVRYFETSAGPWWFGGGIDVTPHYVNESDAVFFHTHLKDACDRHDQAYYPKFKKWADDYFYIRHRKETRGIGGIFFDRLVGPEMEEDKSKAFAFVQEIGNSFLPIYIELLSRNGQKGYSEDEKVWQRVRRGRYVEFNLVWDRGTKFGLDTDGRTESILMSLPPQANWVYDHQTKSGSAEERTQSLLKKDIDWVTYKIS